MRVLYAETRHQSSNAQQGEIKSGTWHGVVRGWAILTRKCGLLRQSHLNLLLDALHSGRLVRRRTPVRQADVGRQPVGRHRAVGLQSRQKHAVWGHGAHCVKFGRKDWDTAVRTGRLRSYDCGERTGAHGAAARLEVEPPSPEYLSQR